MEQERLNVVRDAGLVILAIASCVLALFSDGPQQIGFLIIGVALFTIKALTARIYSIVGTLQSNIESVHHESSEGIRRVDEQVIRLTNVIEEIRRTPEAPQSSPIVFHEPPTEPNFKPVWFIGGSAAAMLLLSQFALYHHVRGTIGTLQSEISRDRENMASMTSLSREAVLRSDAVLKHANELISSMATQIGTIEERVGIISDQAATLREISKDLVPIDEAPIRPHRAGVDLSASRVIGEKPLASMKISSLGDSNARASLSPRALQRQEESRLVTPPSNGFEPFQSPKPNQ